MMWEGHRTVVVDLNQTRAYNAIMPGPLDISPEEEAEQRAH
jgi:hypothetical protein